MIVIYVTGHHNTLIRHSGLQRAPDLYRGSFYFTSIQLLIIFHFNMTIPYTVHSVQNKEIVEVQDNSLVIETTQQFLQLMMNLPSDKVILRREHLHESFFDLRSGLAGDILQKVSNYMLQLSIVGNFSQYDSKSLQAFIYESNKSNRVVFADTVEEALNRLSR